MGLLGLAFFVLRLGAVLTGKVWSRAVRLGLMSDGEVGRG